MQVALQSASVDGRKREFVAFIQRTGWSGSVASRRGLGWSSRGDLCIMKPALTVAGAG
jgi:hypothetical protein